MLTSSDILALIVQGAMLTAMIIFAPLIVWLPIAALFILSIAISALEEINK